MLRIRLASATHWFAQGRAICYHVYVIVGAKDQQLLLVRAGHEALVAASVCPYITCMW